MKDIIDDFRTGVLHLEATGIRSADRHVLRKKKWVKILQAAIMWHAECSM